MDGVFESNISEQVQADDDDNDDEQDTYIENKIIKL